MDFPDVFVHQKYPMTSNPRGNVLIINNDEFENEDEDCRDGASVDFKNLTNLFKKLGFQICSHSNLKYWEMRETIESFAKLKDHEKADMAAVCVLSHGTEDCIKATDGIGLEREWIIAQFNNGNSKILDGKPKMFLFQSCYGDTVDFGVDDKTLKETVKDGVDARPSFEDMIIINASVPGYCSWRDPETGSWLVEAVCEVFQKYAHNTDLRDMLNIVACQMSQKESTELNTRIKQGIEVVSRHFYKKLLFNPQIDIKEDENVKPKPEKKMKKTRWFTRGTGLGSPTPEVLIPTSKDDKYYKMDHRRRGKAYIFNHMHFDPRLQLRTRKGANCDRDNMRITLEQLDFEVEVYDDLPLKEIDRILVAASLEDHSDADCLLVCVTSHGELGILYASDQPYKPDRLWTHFSADKCQTLAGKPKLFLIQGCQGDQLDHGVQVTTRGIQKDSGNKKGLNYKIPNHADFMIAFSTVPGFYSWRNTTAGSWFIQAFCAVIQREAYSTDLLSIMTSVCRKVAFDFQSNLPGDHVMHEKKQIPCVTSMLTRDLLFTKRKKTKFF